MVTDIQTPVFPEALTLPEQARAIVITDQETYNTAASLKIHYAQWRKRIIDEFAPMKEAAHKAHKAITSKEAEYLAPVTEAEGILKAALIKWQDEQARLQRIEQARLEAIARAEAEADRQRREAEARVIMEAERKRDEEARIAAALEAQTAGAGEETVAAILDTPVLDVAPVEAYMEPAAYVAPVVAAPTYQRMVGTGIREVWGCRIVNMKQLCAAIGRGEVPENYVTGTTALNDRARADKGMLKIPGVEPVRK